MAKKKSEPEPETGDDRLSVVVLRGSRAYRDHLHAMSKATMIPITKIIRDAIDKWSVEKGFGQPPEI